MVGATRDRHRDLLRAAPQAAELGRTASAARYTAAAALRAAGAGGVAVVVLGRHLNGEYGTTAVHVRQARLRRFSWDVCPLRPWSHG
ncbi:hypothetical protein ACLMNJ_19530 [Streptomyces seoulensis]